MTDYEFPQLNPAGPIPAPNTRTCGDRPAVRAGRELSAYGDGTYAESKVQQKASQEAAQAARTGNGAYGNMREVETQPSDSAEFEAFDPSA